MKTVVVMALTFSLVGCGRKAQPDAYGNVEATEVVVGAEAAGRLIAFTPKEGQTLDAEATVGSVDATELTLEQNQVAAQRSVNQSRVDEITQQIDALKAQRAATAAQRQAAAAQRASLVAQHEIAQRAYERTERLFRQQAATAQQLDQAERDVRVLAQQIAAQTDQIAAQDHQIAAQAEQIEAARAQRETGVRQVASTDAQAAIVGERVRKSQIRNPVKGTVLVTYAKEGEIVQRGQPLYTIADLRSVDVRAYIGEPDLARVRLGAAMQVTFDSGERGRRALPGTVTWVSSQAEFTPTPIQTRQERADLVYAIKIRVANDEGALKIGMPVDVAFGAVPGK